MKQRSVARDSEVQKQRPGYVNVLSAALDRYSRLPRGRSGKALSASSTTKRAHSSDGKDLQDITLRQLGRVGMGRIESSMVRYDIALYICTYM